MSRMFSVLALVLCGCPEHAPAWYDFTTYTPESTGSSGESGSTGDSSSGESSTGSSGDDTGSGSGAMSSSSSASTASTSSTSTTTGDGTSGGSTSDAPPVCGDGVVDPGEECDDGNAEHNDLCDFFCLRNRLIFASSEEFYPAGILGLEGADSLCRQAANKGGHANWTSFVAWLSDSHTHAGERIYHGLGRYFRTDGVVVVQNAEQFLSGQLDAGIDVDEFGNPAKGGAWTGTRPDGTAVPGSGHCDDWTSNSLLDKGYEGVCGAVDGSWTQQPDPDINPTGCPMALRLYCIEGK